MKTKRTFLNAQWRKLVMANYAVNPEILKKYVPFETEPDFWNGACYISVVGFMFVDTRMLGIRIPLHINFEEINLRFYVKYRHSEGYKRGVVFIKEIVPRPALTFVANTLYGENYETLPTRHNWQETGKTLTVEYGWKKNGRWNSLKAIAQSEAVDIAPGSEEEFITEHFWGYTKISDTATSEYEVSHPRWQIYPVQDYTIDVDFKDVYGPDFAFLQDEKPLSVYLAEGSGIKVMQGARLRVKK